MTKVITGRENNSAKRIFQTLQEQTYFQVPFQMEQSVFDDAISAFFKFLEQPETVKNHIDFTIAPEHRRGDIGFKHRDPNDDQYNDSKDFFHFHPAIFERYADFLSTHPIVNNFALKAAPIWDLTYQTVYKILESLQPQFSNITEKVFATEHVHIVLRFLKYNWQQSGKYLAKPHFDAGSFTLAIAESCSGLRIGKDPDDLKLVEHQDGHAVFMLSSNFKKVMDTDQLYPGWHDVIQLDETLIGKPFARWAIVAFIEAHGVQALPRSETHKWYAGEVG